MGVSEDWVPPALNSWKSYHSHTYNAKCSGHLGVCSTFSDKPKSLFRFVRRVKHWQLGTFEAVLGFGVWHAITPIISYHILSLCLGQKLGSVPFQIPTWLRSNRIILQQFDSSHSIFNIPWKNTQIDCSWSPSPHVWNLKTRPNGSTWRPRPRGPWRNPWQR